MPRSRRAGGHVPEDVWLAAHGGSASQSRPSPLRRASGANVRFAGYLDRRAPRDGSPDDQSAEGGCSRLRQLREERGWTQQEAAEQLARLAWFRDHKHVGVNADMVAKWERGAKGISPYYVALLCLLFGVTADYLGLRPAHSQPSSGVLSTVDLSLVNALSGAAAVYDQLGPASKPSKMPATSSALPATRPLARAASSAS